MHIGGSGGWDYLTVDAETHRLFVPRSTHTMVIDADSGRVLGDIPGQKIAHGVAIVPSVGRGFITDGGGEGSIVIFDLKNYAILGKLAAVPDSDGIIYDAALSRVFAVSGDKGVLMSFPPDIDPVNGKIDTTIALGGAPEFLASDGAGTIYVNLMDKNEVAVVDFKTKKVAARWPVAPGGAPVGLAIDLEAHRLYIGARKPAKLVVMSTESGKVLGDLPIGPGVDATLTSQGYAFASSGDGTLAIAKETAPGTFQMTQTLQTKRGARTMGMNKATGVIYMPTAEYEDAKPGATGRPAMKPDSFMIVVVAPLTPKE